MRGGTDAGQILSLIHIFEKKLIGWSLTIGLVLLVGLALFNHFVPVTF